MTEETRRAWRRWWATMLVLPAAALQGRLLRRKIPLLPEASGARRGQIGDGDRILRLAVLGESTAAGVGVETQDQALAAQLARVLAERHSTRVHWQAIGRTGLTIDKAFRELLPELDGPIDAAVAVFGVNDTIKLTSSRTWSHELVAFADALFARGAQQLLFTAAPPFEHFAVLPNPLRTVLGLRARYMNALLADALAGIDGARSVAFERLDPSTELARDRFHPSALGYARWARHLAEAL